MKVPGTVSSVLSQKASSTVWSISRNATVFDAVQMMDAKNIGALPVVDGGRVIGMVSERDYARKIILRGKASRDTRVQDIMTTTVFTTTPGESVNECLRSMTEHRIRHLPVVENDQLIGLVSIGDLVNWVIRAQSATIDHLEGYISGRYPA